MKKTLFILTLLITTSLSAQEDWGSVDKNKVTLKEIAPVWPGCENSSAIKTDSCFKQMLAKHIVANYKYPAEEYNKNIEGKVIVVFMINEEGLPEIKDVKGGNAGLQAEAKRNIMSIPKMAKPGMLGGKPRAIQYTVPINFKTGK